MNTSKRIISLLMCMLMVLSIVPMSVFAAETTEIDTVQIEGVPAPVYGQTIKSYYEAIEAKITDGTITVNDEVYDSTAYKYGNLLDDGWNVRSEADAYLSSTSTDLIKEGTYYVAMWFLPDNGYVIPEDVNVLFDGAKSVKIEVESDGCLDIRAEFEVKCPHTYDSDCDAECNLCTEIRTAPHAYDNACDAECNNCPATRTPAAHTGGTATCTEKAKCSVCGEAYGSVNKDNHKSITTLKAVAATCTKEGKTEGKKCTACGTVTVAQKTVAKKAHTYKNVTTKATLSKNGKVESKCSVCGNVSKTTTVYYPKTIKLSKTAYTYNGKVQTPSVTVKDTAGDTLKKDTDYTVKYESGRKAPGKYTVTITFKGKYEGTKKLTYTIAPKKVTKLSASQTTTTITLKWSKVTGADAYRVYKYNSKTKKYEKLKDVTKTTLKISKLKAGTAYKYKVRAITKDDGSIYGAYSDVFEAATKCKTPSISKLTSSKKGVASLTWTNVSGESGYQVYYSTKKDSGYKKADSYKVNAVKGSKTKLKSGKKYYFKVRAYKKTAAGTVYSSWSAVKSVKIK